jgi:hypothetical protein
MQTVLAPVFQPFFMPPEDWDVPYAYEHGSLRRFAE